MTAVLNTPSQALMRHLGMTPYQRFDHPGVEVGHPLRAHVVYRITRESGPAVLPETAGKPAV